QARGQQQQRERGGDPALLEQGAAEPFVDPFAHHPPSSAMSSNFELSSTCCREARSRSTASLTRPSRRRKSITPPRVPPSRSATVSTGEPAVAASMLRAVAGP